ncbi:hypothetical protein O7600_14380 [Micromonospora sp. WMMA1998]|uniref:hypothetical protein n=1 Tax=Micromonospora sp. WMMA1998 TaxID=3015167 RepID=UPI00248B64EE|nr:hypothetical protein [Micromonospora sp. WMMA1998]WBC17929.1 hypothetical protein O7600_14380 [Micromonospora sp. WMMA1998]
MRVRDRLTAVVVTLALVLAALGSAAALPAAGPSAAGPSAAGPSAAVPASGCRAGPGPAAYPRRWCVELSGGWWGDRRGGPAYGDGPDEPLPAAPPSVAGPVVAARLAPGRRPPPVPLPARGALAARAPPTA